MGNANKRGNFEKRKQQAIAEGRIKGKRREEREFIKDLSLSGMQFFLKEGNPSPMPSFQNEIINTLDRISNYEIPLIIPDRRGMFVVYLMTYTEFLKTCKQMWE